MTISEALEEVSRIYPPGCAKYFERMRPDPWQAAHDELERNIKGADEETIDISCELFVRKCKTLVKRFETESGATIESTPQDAFHMGPDRLRRHQSIRFKQCVECGCETGLKIERNKEDPSEVWLICAGCRGAGAA